MKYLFATLIAAMTLALTASAQTTNTGTITPSQAADIIIEGLEGGASNWVFAVDGLYAPHATSGGQFGAIGIAGYQVNDYLLIGAHVEWLNDLPTYGGGQLTLGLPLHPFPTIFPKVSAEPWAFVGSGTSFGQHKPVTVVGETAAGLAIGIYKSPHDFFEVGLNAGVGKRTDIGGEEYIGGIDCQLKFK